MPNQEHARYAEAFNHSAESYSFIEKCLFEVQIATRRLARLTPGLARLTYHICELLRQQVRRVSAMYLK